MTTCNPIVPEWVRVRCNYSLYLGHWRAELVERRATNACTPKPSPLQRNTSLTNGWIGVLSWTGRCQG